MKKYLVHIIMATLCIGLTVLLACQKNEPITQGKTESSNNLPAPNGALLRTSGVEILADYGSVFSSDFEVGGTQLFLYEAETSASGTTESSLVVRNSSGSLITFTYVLDVGPSNYKYNQHNVVIEKAEDELDSFTPAEIESLSAQFHSFLLGSVGMASLPESEKVQSMAYYYAILNVISRKLNGGTVCECTPLPFYFTGKSPFGCQEDYMVDKSVLLAVWDSVTNPTHDDSLMYNFVVGQSVNTFPFINLFTTVHTKTGYLDSLSLIYNYLENNPSATTTDVKYCPNGKGSDPGCCGNYHGCCWYTHWLCKAHDEICRDCEYWFCTKWCVPNWL